jgi:hypothetical protein
MTSKANAIGRASIHAAVLLVTLAGATAAQAQQAAPETIVADDKPDTVRFSVGFDLERHSNLFAIPNGPSDTMLRVPLSVFYDRDFGNQRLRLDATATPVKYLDNSRLDYVGYNAGGVWDIEFGRPAYGQLEGRLSRLRTPFDSSLTAVENLENRRFLRGLAGFRMTPSWSLFGAVDQAVLDNSGTISRQNDYTFFAYETGLRYEPGNATDIDFFYRRTDGDYPNRQVLDSNGNVLPGGVDNNFKQDALLGRLTYKPTYDTSVTGTAGWTRRDYANVPERNFTGLTLGVLADWQWSGAVRMRLNLVRDIIPDTSLNASWVEIQRIAFDPQIRISGRTTLVPTLSWERRLYDGDPGFVISGNPARRDTLTRWGLEARYEFARNVYLNGYFWSLKRGSNYALYEFTDNVLGLGVRSYF